MPRIREKRVQAQFSGCLPGPNAIPRVVPLTAPAHLQPGTQAWWDEICRDYDLASHHVKLLTLAAQAWDRAEEARRAIEAAGGPFFDDRFGQPRTHPAVAVERDARTAFARLIRELDLEGEPPPDPRPPRRR